MMADKVVVVEEKKDPSLALQVAKQMVVLATSGFGLVAALAWNNLIKEFVDNYIGKWLPNGGSLLSLLIYALIITALAVIVTTNLTRTVDRLERLEEKLAEDRKKRD